MIPPVAAIEDWRVYVRARQERLNGCRWAVVTRGDSAIVDHILDTAAQDAESSGIVLKHFTDIVEAHLWLKSPSANA